MTTTPLPSTRKQLVDEMLAAVTRAEQAEAAHERTRGRLENTQIDLVRATAERDHLQAVLDEVRSFHNEWADTEDAENTLSLQILWEDLLQILGPPPAQDTTSPGTGDPGYDALGAELAAAEAAQP
ncbi:hypothetical protein EFK50_01215 [Nocardioides marmoriginsengisoli]|uniref:Uncharacterized protein n=1 Tax=Nocardioides marmoriginsengisoli TaxID=661483 RepID=A0A3N0CTE0_9ACTN|nr:hypothetical protein [Nocardioides marmoriginsengisoli]RNL66276.1 hypothetical protein EFK50_01215 [Nocardioides marmoriginsengisoli]